MLTVSVSIRTAPVTCWSCDLPTRIVSSILLERDMEKAVCSVADLTDFPPAADLLAAKVASLDTRAGRIRMRHSNMMGRSYASNGCSSCDSLFGNHYEIHARYDERHVGRFTGEPADQWNIILDALLASPDGCLFR